MSNKTGCTVCGKIQNRPYSRGLCTSCYGRAYARKRRTGKFDPSPVVWSRGAKARPPAERVPIVLQLLRTIGDGNLERGWQLGFAKKHGVSRQYIHILINNFVDRKWINKSLKLTAAGRKALNDR